jgi:hypothetical protein
VFTGAFESSKNAVIRSKDAIKGFVKWTVNMGKSAVGVGKTVGTKLLGPLKTLSGFLKGLGPKFLSSMGKLKNLGKTNPITIAIIGMLEGFWKVKKAAGDFMDYLGSIPIGMIGAFGELAQMIYGDLPTWIGEKLGLGLGKISLIDSIGGWINREVFGIEMSFTEAWAELDWAGIGEAWVYMFDEAWKAVKDFLGISSPSKLFMEIGTNIIDSITGALDPQLLIDAATFMITAFIEPWKSLGSLLMEIIQPALDIVPDFVKDIFTGGKVGSEKSAKDLAAHSQNNAAAAAYRGSDQTAQPQVIHISLNLDGKQIDKKIINVVGGVVKQAVQ